MAYHIFMICLQVCEDAGHKCVTHIDGYYVESVICFIIGLIWLGWKSKKVKQLQETPAREWTVMTN